MVQLLRSIAPMSSPYFPRCGIVHESDNGAAEFNDGITFGMMASCTIVVGFLQVQFFL